MNCDSVNTHCFYGPSCEAWVNDFVPSRVHLLSADDVGFILFRGASNSKAKSSMAQIRTTDDVQCVDSCYDVPCERQRFGLKATRLIMRQMTQTEERIASPSTRPTGNHDARNHH